MAQLLALLAGKVSVVSSIPLGSCSLNLSLFSERCTTWERERARETGVAAVAAAAAEEGAGASEGPRPLPALGGRRPPASLLFRRPANCVREHPFDGE